MPRFDVTATQRPPAPRATISRSQAWTRQNGSSTQRRKRSFQAAGSSSASGSSWSAGGTVTSAFTSPSSDRAASTASAERVSNPKGPRDGDGGGSGAQGRRELVAARGALGCEEKDACRAEVDAQCFPSTRPPSTRK